MKEESTARIEAVPLLALLSWRAWLRDGWQTHPTVPTTTPPSESKSPKLDSRDQGSQLHSYYLWSFGSTMHSKWKRWANKTGQSCLHSLPADGWWKATQAGLRQPWPPSFSGKCGLRSFHCFSEGGKGRPPVEVSIWIIMSSLSLWASAGATARHGITLYVGSGGREPGRRRAKLDFPGMIALPFHWITESPFPAPFTVQLLDLKNINDQFHLCNCCHLPNYNTSSTHF